MGRKGANRVPYDQRPDDEKLESNWSKAKRQFDRKDWSASILRVATSAEIAANIYIRQFLSQQYELPEHYVDSLLIFANGLQGKFNRLIRPAAEVEGTWDDLKGIRKKIEALHTHRNGIAHSGRFKKRSEAKVSFEHALKIIRRFVPQEADKLTLPYKS